MADVSPLPIIDAGRCSGCRLCVDVCPTGALAQVDGKAVLVNPDLCTYCTACEDVCPDAAIALPFLIVFAPTSTHPSQRDRPPKKE